MRIGLATSGLLPLSDLIGKILQGKCIPLGRSLKKPDVVVGWGNKETSHKAQSYAKRNKLPYVAFEDGFLRSIRPGSSELPLSIVMDRTGIYYDSTRPSDLEALVRKRISLSRNEVFANIVLDTLRGHKLSKYNDFVGDNTQVSMKLNDSRSKNILVVDQTAGDASILWGNAKASSFLDMLECAVSENLDCSIVVKTHPEAIVGSKAGHIDKNAINKLAKRCSAFRKALREDRILLISDRVNPWVLLERCSKVYCVSSQLGFEGLMAGCEVHCYGVPFFAGWGLTQDRIATHRKRGQASLPDLVAAVYADYCIYYDHNNGEFISFSEAASKLRSLRDTVNQSS